MTHTDPSQPVEVARSGTDESHVGSDLSLVVLRNVPYLPSTNDRHCVDLYIPPPSAQLHDSTDRPLLVFLHGGAWRTNQPADFELLATRLAHATHLPVAVPGYRMSLPANDPARPIHPAHQMDIEHALAFLTATGPMYGWNVATRGFCLIGHSAGSHLATRILLDPVTPAGAQLHVRSIVALDGIYDLDDMVDEYGEYYRVFTEQAFGPPQGWPAASPVHSARDPTKVREGAVRRRCEHVLVVHSRDDELLSLRQSEAFYAAICAGNEAAQGAIKYVDRDFDSVGGKHDEMLVQVPLVQLVRRFVKERMT